MPRNSVERGKETRQRLLDAAVVLVPEVGWSAVTTRLAAERAGVAPGVVHYHFASVTDLLVAAGLGFTGGLLDALAAELSARPGIADGVDWLLGELSRYSGTDPASLLMVEMFLAATRLPELREPLAEQIGRFRACVASWLAERGYQGDAAAAATVLAASIDGIMLHRALDPGLDPAALAGPLRAMFGSPAFGSPAFGSPAFGSLKEEA
ncbi:DNA-binding transcriptional regulator, AcrR family [Nonomuraea solani]|uniref:DNA-binding transcriptional regulator, AcrR family n=1 Tax=Nonomuraea solani TaxID=1144553 RepID=A0A1H5UHM3_9ACTN|nr:TetR/AcrR family transcriptional regulator [Nonomuraea solani]SEF74555.1 DNA-binding transcriptional regulator, AcrR family [Nonomuraea solani]